MIKSTGLLGVPTPDLLAPALAFTVNFGRPAIQKIFPIVDVARFKDNFVKNSTKDLLAVNNTRRGRGDLIKTRESQRDYDGYETLNEELQERVPFEDIAEYPNAEQEAANNVTLAVVRSVERNGAAQLAAATVTSGTNLLAVSTPWTTVASATPLADFNTVAGYIRANYGITKNNLSIAIPRKHFDAFPTIADFKTTLSVTTDITGEARIERIRAYFGCKEVVVLEMQYDSANLGQTASVADCWDSNNAYVYWNADNFSDGTMPKTAGMGRMFCWNSPAQVDPAVYQEMVAVAADFGVPPIQLRKYVDPTTKSVIVGAGAYCTTKIINTQALARLGSLG